MQTQKERKPCKIKASAINKKSETAHEVRGTSDCADRSGA